MCPFYRTVGRPRLEVSFDYIEYLRGLRFSFTEIAILLGISRATLYRRLSEAGVSYCCAYTDICDADLDAEVLRIKVNHPNDGERLMSGHLTQRGIIVPRARLRASIHRVDPENTALRRSIAIRRRVYCVDGPNSLWHIDTHHKLIRWKLVTHGGIDGYSRTIVYLSCADNNRATTALNAFSCAVYSHGLPQRVRTDCGGENIDIWRYIVQQHGSTSAVITGSSTHNERIERLWRDVHRCVTSLFYDVFRRLESEHKMDPLNDTDLYCLHYVFLPRINATLASFCDTWNNHPLSTMRNLTPNQLFITGALEQNLIPEMPQHPQQVNQQLPSVTNRVEVPRITFAPCATLQHDLTTTVDPLRPSNEFGYDIYCQAINIIGLHLHAGYSDCTAS